MKIKRFNESSEFEEIEDTLLDIYDLLGEPTKDEYKVGSKTGYTLRWELGFQIDEFNGVDELDKITKVFDILKGIRSSQSRISGYDIEFKITHILIIRLTPHSDEVSDSYKFFIATLVKNELEKLSEDELDRPIFVTGYNNGIEFVPEEEKCYVELDRYN